MGNKINKKELFLKPLELKKYSGVSRSDLSSIIEFDSSVAEEEEGVPVYALIRALNKSFQSMIKKGIVTGEAFVDISQEMQFEKLQKERILNQTKLGILMRKEEAYSRVLNLVRMLNNLMKHVILSTSSMMVDEGYTKDKRKAEIFLTECWNEAIDFIEDNVEILDWEVDGEARLTRTRLDALEELEKGTYED